MSLNPEQEVAVTQMADHCHSRGASDFPFFLLEGPAGTGKTFCMSELVERVKKRIVFTAPTNKAVKVLREALTTADYKPDCCTIYSLLGLMMAANGEVKELSAPEEEVDLSTCDIVVIDEGSMNGTLLMRYVKSAAESHPKLRWIIMGDRWQLPPVGEDWSPIWAEAWPRATLTQIMRQDNQILRLSAQVRGLIETPMRALTLRNDHDGVEGVWTWNASELEVGVKEDAKAFLDGSAKFIAWRNVKVDTFNRIIRQELFADGEKYPWQPGDRITMLGPIKDLLKTKEDGSHPLCATTDEEGMVERADLLEHPEFKEFLCWRILWRSDFNTSATLWVLHPSMRGKFDQRVARLAAEAKAERKLWAKFWDFKDAFHPVRHAYAITAHRAQGSTYTRAYVNWRDIMLNQNRSEAYRCLYVAVTRPKKELYLG